METDPFLGTLFGERWDDALPGLLLLLLGEGVAVTDGFIWMAILPSFGARCHEALREIIHTRAYRTSPFLNKKEAGAEGSLKFCFSSNSAIVTLPSSNFWAFVNEKIAINKQIVNFLKFILLFF